MNRRNLTIVATTAAMSMALTLAVFWPADLGASGEPAGAAPEVAVPTLKVNGCELSLRSLFRTYNAGEIPQLELRMVNPTDAPVNFEVFATMLAQSPGSELSRREPAMQEIWHESCPVSLGAHETKTVTIDTHKAVAAGQRVLLQLQSGKQVISAGAFQVPRKPVEAAGAEAGRAAK